LLLAAAAVLAGCALWASRGEDTTTEARNALPPGLQFPEILPATVTNPPNIMQCFQVSQGDHERAEVALFTGNFGWDVADIREMNMMCEEASKDGNPPLPTTADDIHIFACYKLEKGADPNDPVGLGTENFGEDFLQVRWASRMCESAQKYDAQTGNYLSGATGSHILVCYDLRGGASQNERHTLDTNNFPEDRVLIAAPVQMCEEGVKGRICFEIGPYICGLTGQTTNVVWECFAMSEADSTNRQFILNTNNFGDDRVTVGRSNMMCEGAMKFRYPGLPPVTTADDPNTANNP
jgi:hypothetical protein